MRAEERRESLLTAARGVFASKGYHRASVSDIIGEAGVARGTFYNHFASKRDIFRAILHELSEEVSAAVQPIALTRPIPPQVRANLGRIIRAAIHPEVARLLFTEAAVMDAEADGELLEFYDRALGRIETALATGQRLGWVREGDMALASRCLLGMVKEPIFQAGLRDEDLDPEHLVDEIFEFFLRGLLR